MSAHQWSIASLLFPFCVGLFFLSRYFYGSHLPRLIKAYKYICTWGGRSVSVGSQGKKNDLLNSNVDQGLRGQVGSSTRYQYAELHWDTGATPVLGAGLFVMPWGSAALGLASKTISLP